MDRARLTRRQMLLALAGSTLLAACGGTAAPNPVANTPVTSGGTTSPTSASAAATAAPTARPAASVAGQKVVFWYGLGGALGKVVETMIKMYNDEESPKTKITFEGVFQGSYEESLIKYKAAIQSKDVPSLLQSFEVGTRSLIDSESIVPMQTFIDREKYDLTDLEPNLANYFKLEGKLYSMPFNHSTPIMYYNKGLFKQAGLDPEKPPRTYEDIAAAAEKLTSSGAAQFGFAQYVDSWLMEQTFAVNNAPLFDNDNGRTGRAQKSFANEMPATKWLEWWKMLIDKKIAGYYGKTNADVQSAFYNGKIGMIVQSTANLRAAIDSIAGKFELGTGFFPRPSDAKGGTILGGASVWITKDQPVERQDASWEVVKWLASPKVQAFWHINTGYYPTRRAAYDDPTVKEWQSKYPQFTTAIEQLRSTQPNNATLGAIVGPLPEARVKHNEAMEKILGNQAPIKATLDDAVNQINDILSRYNRTAPKY